MFKSNLYVCADSFQNVLLLDAEKSELIQTFKNSNLTALIMKRPRNTERIIIKTPLESRSCRFYF
jgi:hypothetical protein